MSDGCPKYQMQVAIDTFLLRLHPGVFSKPKRTYGQCSTGPNVIMSRGTEIYSEELQEFEEPCCSPCPSRSFWALQFLMWHASLHTWT